MKRLVRGAARTRWLVALVGLTAVVLLVVSSRVCLSSGFQYGLWVNQCPDGDPVLTVSAAGSGLARGAERELRIMAMAHYTTGKADLLSSAVVESFTPTVTLVDGAKETPLEPKKGWKTEGGQQVGLITIPTVNDGDYKLRVKVTSRVGTAQADLPLALYAPARIHVLTDRPLYEPGNTVKFRALALKGNDLTPLDERPGTWFVRDPSGEVVMQERVAAGAWGVVTGSFPLDGQATSGAWTVEWASGNHSGSRSFDVRPFTLPRFRVETTPGKPFYGRGERPVLRGEVRYSSGAPVPDAKLEFTWSTSGEWPPPTAWTDGSALPKAASAGANGRFSVELPAVPMDLQGKATLSAHVSATDRSGDRIDASASILLSEDPISVDAVTELEGGLIEGFNNRLFLRATTADGRVLPGADLVVRRLWEPTDKGTATKADEDGVAQLQVDPGPAVNVVIPPQPFRPPPRAKQVTRGELVDHFAEDSEPSLADRLAFDRLESSLERCTRYADADDQARGAVSVDASGAVRTTAFTDTALGRCVEQGLKGLRLGTGKERLFTVSYAFNDEDLPRFVVEANTSAANGPLEAEEQAINQAMSDVRDCAPPTVVSGVLPRRAVWSRSYKGKQLELRWVSNPDGERKLESVAACVEGRLKKLELKGMGPLEDRDPSQDVADLGFVSVRVDAPAKYEAERPQATIMEGYELSVTAKAGKEVLGTTRVRLRPGAVPPLRLRLSSQLVNPGDVVEAQLLRGPDFQGDLPELAYLELGRTTKEEKVDRTKKTVSFTIPKDAQGWARISALSAQVFLFVRPQSPLAVSVKSEKERYAPGQLARLELETRIGDQGKSAAVGLFGVDDSLGQLVSLPGADELSSLRPQVSSSGGFGGLDAQALMLGRIRGAQAQAATLLKVNALPPPSEIEPSLSVSGGSTFDPNEALTDRFYGVLEELHAQVRTWEAKAPEAEKMSPRTMARLWSQAIDAVEARHENARDAFHRKLRLHRLPADLLALTDPRQVVVAGTRLPEDTENWSAWVAKEKP
ncbi:MAG: hypothetical protein K1X89_11715 [Myxococcaceae bacterium]|nr:hypothetical protein [Myxococcaceae bacterium]